jgi:ribosomal protein S18 acetylase RimI-like enzyme
MRPKAQQHPRPAIELRDVCEEDAAAVLALHDLALERAGAHGGRGPWEDDLHDLRGHYVEPGGCFLVGFRDGELVAMGGFVRHSPSEAEIKRMRVHPDHQRQGLGRLLLEALEERARAAGCTTIRLDTTTLQTAARRLYESAGYREAGRRRAGRFVLVDYVKEPAP